MYLDYWNLTSLPFETTPDPQFFFESKGHREALARMIFAIRRHKPLALITGDYGTGKTMLCHKARIDLAGPRFKVGFVSNPCMDEIDLIRETVYQLGGEAMMSRSKFDLLHSLNDLMQRHAKGDKRCVVIIDEAHLITDVVVLENLRVLLNYNTADKHLLTLILTGQTEMRDTLRHLPQLMQRVSVQAHIPNLEPDEVRSYIRHRIETAGGTMDIFDRRAIAEIETLAGGNPRQINNICDLCLLATSTAGITQVTWEQVVDAANEMASGSA